MNYQILSQEILKGSFWNNFFRISKTFVELKKKKVGFLVFFFGPQFN